MEFRVKMAVKVFVLVVIKFYWTVAQLHSPSVGGQPNFGSRICSVQDDRQDYRLKLNLLPGNPSINEDTTVDDFQATQCAISGKFQPSISETPLENYRDDINTVEFTSSNITAFATDFFCYFTKIRFLNVSHNRLNDTRKLGLLGLHDTCGRHLTRLDLTGNPLTIITNNSLGHLRGLSRLHLNNCQLTSIESGATRSLTRLSELSLSTNRLRSLSGGLFKDDQMMYKLQLDNNQLDAVPEVIRRMEGLVYLDLSRNRISTLSRLHFGHCPILQDLNLAHNRIISIESQTFDSNQRLNRLDLSYNRLQNISATLFDNATIDTLRLNNNLLTRIHFKQFFKSVRRLHLKGNLVSPTKGDFDDIRTLQRLELLDLSYNNLSTVNDLYLPDTVRSINISNNHIASFTFHPAYSVRISRGKSSLETVDLQNNNLSYVSMLASHESLFGIYPVYMFNGNPLKCSCENTWFIQNSLTSSEIPCEPVHTFTAGHLLPSMNVISTDRLCESSYLNSNRCAIQHNPSQDTTKCEFRCPSPCYCYTTLEFSAVHLYCSNGQMTTFPSLDNEEISKKTEVHLWFDGNNYTKLNATDFQDFSQALTLHLNHSNIYAIGPDTFHHLIELTMLNLADNHLHTLPIGVFHVLTRLQQLYLSNNNIESFENETFLHLKSLQILHLHDNKLSQFMDWNLKNFPQLQQLTLHGNDWVCDCTNALPLHDYLLSSRFIQNASAVECVTEDTTVPALQFNRAHCAGDTAVSTTTDAVTKSITVVWIIIALCFGALSLFVYRREMRVMWYSRLRPRGPAVNEAEGKLFDAFIAYNSDDEEFVCHRLLPGLEAIDHPYRVCVHERDFLAGNAITDNILEAVRISSRTVIVLSESFVRSGWCRFEFKAAHMQMLQDRCPRVLVVVVDRVPSTLDPEMRLYLSTNTYLRWGERLFWRKLYQAMPRRRVPRTPLPPSQYLVTDIPLNFLTDNTGDTL